MSSANAYPQPPQCALEHRGATTVADEIHGRMLAQGERVRDSLRPLSDPSLSDEAVWAIVDAAPDGFVVVDAANQILMVNRQTEEIFGYDRGDLLGRSLEELLPERFREIHRGHSTRYRAEPRTRPMGAGLILFARRQDGTEFPVEISLSPLQTSAGLQVVAVVRDITARLEAEDRLRRAEQDLQLVEDRERIARDLHDTVIQKLFAAGMTIQGVWSRTTDEDQSRRLSAVIDDLDATIREIRSVIFGLKANGLADSGVRSQILRVASEERLALGYEPRVRFDGPIETMSEAIAGELLPTLREALSNVARHADASSVEVEVDVGDNVVLRVLDDGRGLPATATGGRGISNITERAALLGGQCRASARPDGGTALEWLVPNSA